ncbi:MAG: tetratricopeptide repeat protein [Chloroflexota bacterium]
MENPLPEIDKSALEHQFERLSQHEQEILLWLAIYNEPMVTQEIRALLFPIPPQSLVENTLDGLLQLSLLRQSGSTFGLPKGVATYLMDYFVKIASTELITGELNILHRHSLFMAQAAEYIRRTQIELILDPLASALSADYTRPQIKNKMQTLLDRLRYSLSEKIIEKKSAERLQSYAAGNILNLLIHMRMDLSGYDFSYLPIQGAYLQGTSLQSVDFTGANFRSSVFTDTFRTIERLAIHPNGETFAASTADGEIWLWQLSDRQLQSVLTDECGAIVTTAFSPDGQTIIGGCTDHNVRVWDVGTAQLLLNLQGHTDVVWSVTVSPNRKILASGSSDMTIRLWDAQTGEPLETLHDHGDEVTVIAFSPDGKTMASGSADRTIQLWDTQKWQVRQILRRHTHKVNDVAFSPTSKDGWDILATAADDGLILLWDLHSTNGGAVRHLLKGHTGWVNSVAFSPDGRLLASGSSDQTVRIWNVQTGHLLNILEHAAPVWSAHFVIDGSTLVTNANNIIYFWDIQTGRLRNTLQGHSDLVRSIVMGPDGTMSVSIANGKVRLLNMMVVPDGYRLDARTRSGFGQPELELPESVQIKPVQLKQCREIDWTDFVALSRDGRTIATGGIDKQIRMIKAGEEHPIVLADVTPSRATSENESGQSQVQAIGFSSDDQLLVTANSDQALYLRDVQNGRVLRKFQTRGADITPLSQIAVSQGGNYVAMASLDSVVHIWAIGSLDDEAMSTASEADSAHASKMLRGHSGDVHVVAFSPDGQLLASGSKDQTIRLWRIGETTSLLKILEGHTNWIWSVAFSSDGATLASGSEDGTARLWDVNTGEILHTLTHDSSWIYTVAFSPDGRVLASSGGDEAIYLWNAETGERLTKWRIPGPYAGMNITQITGVPEVQKSALKSLGAIEMGKLIVYIPMDRRHAIAKGEALPDRTTGAALFADISGFTPLTEALVRELGPQRGAEELTNYLNLVYDALIEEVHRYGGSVIAFAGDAITCWLDGKGGPNAIACATIRATNCALAMQQAMKQFEAVETPNGTSASLSMKAAVAAGPVRRFVVGDPKVRVLDALAGETLVRLAAAEHQAEKGEVILDAMTLEQLYETIPQDALQITDARHDPELDLHFSIVSCVNLNEAQAVVGSFSPNLVAATMNLQEVRTWLLPSVYERINRGLEEFLAELRPTAALFLRFEGIEYDQDDQAGQKLDDYIRWVQRVVASHEGTFIDLNIGDKGSYIYINFGAPLAHENNAAHAASTALALRHPPAEFDFMAPVQIGISQGRMRAGVYGGTNHRTYGVLGDEVNMAARLMMKARPGQILVSEAAHRSIVDIFALRTLPRMRVKGKKEPIAVFALEDRQSQTDQTSNHSLPMLGRDEELGRIRQLLKEIQRGHGQIIALLGEAGVGKTRLADEIMRNMNEQGWQILRGACESYGTNSSYLVWQPIWRMLFGLDASNSNEEQLARLSAQVHALNPNWVQRMPLLDVVLQLSIPETDLTRSLDAKVRKTSLQSLLVDVLRMQTASEPTLIVLEDCHWLDPLSYELLQDVYRAVSERPVCVLIISRELTEEQVRELDALPHATQISLEQFQPKESAQLVGLKVAQLSDNTLNVSDTLVEQLIEQSQGNPFYLEELTAYLYYQGALGENGSDENQPELPDSLHRLVLSRLDLLSESQKITARVASVIGRVFQAAWLWGAYPQLGAPNYVRSDLEALQEQALTVGEPSELELTYFFKQVLTQTVTYESLPYAMRSAIHEQVGQFIEKQYADTLDQYLDRLAYHYDRSDNEVKRQTYLLQAAEAAQSQYANLAAIDYYKRVLPLLTEEPSINVRLKLGQVLELTGQWQDARSVYETAVAGARSLGDSQSIARCETAMGELLRKQGDYHQAGQWLERAQRVFETLGDPVGVGQVLHIRGTLSAQQGDYDQAQLLYENSLAIRRELDEQANIASLLSNLGILARFRDDYDKARALYEESLVIRRQLEDPRAIANSLNNLGLVARYQNDHASARALLTESLEISREVGDPWAIANTLHSLGEVAIDQRDYEAAIQFLTESLVINRSLNDKRAIAFVLECFAILGAEQNQPEYAWQVAGAATALRESIQSPLSPAEEERLQQKLGTAQRALDDSARQEALARGQSMPLDKLLDALLSDQATSLT